jgi:hypothetical protein
MNVLKLIRKPQLSIVMSALILFVSCEQYDLNSTQAKIDYSAYNQLKSMKIDFAIPLNESKSTNAEISMLIEETVNNEFNTDLNLPEDFHSFHSYDGDQMLNEAKQKGWISQKRENFLRAFFEDLKTVGVELAISNHEQRILDANLNEDEFARETLFLNTIKYLDDEGTFNSNRSIGSLENQSCWWAVIVFISATIGLVICVTVLACAIASIGYVNAGNNLVNECF